MYTSHETLIALAVLCLSVGATFLSRFREKRLIPSMFFTGVEVVLECPALRGSLLLPRQSEPRVSWSGSNPATSDALSSLYRAAATETGCSRHLPSEMRRVASPTHHQLQFFNKMSLVSR